MMRYCTVIFLLFTLFFSTLESRYPPSSSHSSCLDGKCNQSDCSSGQCGQNVGQPQYVGQPQFRTCSYCVSHCTSRCNNDDQCLNFCLQSCNCNLPRTTSCEGGDCTNPISIKEPVPLIPKPSPCCEVYHPKSCYTEETGNKRCFVRRHRECSDLCSSSVVSLEETERAPSSCHYIRNYPYVYCGNYERQNCGQCQSQTCEESYNPGQCSKTSECTQGCRNLGRNVQPRTGGPLRVFPEQFSY